MISKVQTRPSRRRGYLDKLRLFIGLLAVFTSAHHTAMYCDYSGSPVQIKPDAYSLKDIHSFHELF